MKQTTFSDSTKKISIVDINRAIKALKEDRVYAVEIRLKKCHSEFKKMTLDVSIGANMAFGVPLILDKKVPEDECWIKDSNGITSKIKLHEEHLPVSGRMSYGMKSNKIKPINIREGVV